MRALWVILIVLMLPAVAGAQCRVEHGCTGSLANSGTDDTILIGDTNSFEEVTLSECTTGQKLQYTLSTNAFTCATDTDAESKCATGQLLDGDGFCPPIPTECSTSGCSLAAGTTIQNGTPVADAAGEVGVDTTDDQFVYYGTAEHVLGYKGQACATIENLAALDDNFQFWSTAAAVTITDFWCRYEGTGTTVATFALEDSGGTAMTHTAPTCVTGGTNATVQGVTAANALVIGEGLRFDVTNAVSPETDTYTLCVLFTLTRT